ncbi:hypothetical protein QO230_00640 [Vibrio vulnificus]|uniref:hypothetical protein n=1 Tax=Vibrio vulnificus TaxID=672 RepID=UPI0024DF7883|nr:hypothetical protein [Vibrio vulnificus]MDK2606122.1 hypothetical protein [Vibrio vulnificus]MDK2609866.1 hypothetical protein [Vibrio vulnificus]MDK2627364.1 hypothetical protein [Vibrio vulnificus]MDK2702809.1 hypothetical protein [Vibrio vulnificus]
MSFEKLKRNHEKLIKARAKPSTKGERTPASDDPLNNHLFELFDLVKRTIWRSINYTSGPKIKVKASRQSRTHHVYEVQDCASIHVWVVPDAELHITVHPYDDAKYLEAVANNACRHVVTQVHSYHPQYKNYSRFVVV